MSFGYQDLNGSVYANGRPGWAGYGVVMEGSITPAEAIDLAKQRFEVKKESLYRRYTVQNDTVNGYVAQSYEYRPLDHLGGITVRTDLDGSDVRSDLGIVGPGYNPVQHTEVFESAALICKEYGATVETAGTLRNGKQVWMLLAMPQGDNVRDDKIARFLLITTRHDGKGAIQFLSTNVRVICANTLAMAISGARNKYSIRHTTMAEDRLGKVLAVLSDSEEYFKRTHEKFDHWANTKVHPDLADMFVEALLPIGQQSRTTYIDNQRGQIVSLFKGRQRGSEMEAIKGTAYGLYNAVTEWIDHERSTRTRRTLLQRPAQEAKFDSTMFGSGAALRQRAGYLVNELVRAVDTDRDDVRDLLGSIDYGKTVRNKLLDEMINLS